MTQGKLLEATALVGAAMVVLGAGLVITLPWFPGIAGGALIVVGLVTTGRSVVKLRSHAAPDAAVAGPPPVVIAALAALLAGVVPLVVHVKIGLFSSAVSAGVLVAALLVVAAAAVLAVRWSR